jgi:hypothetical protein
MEEKLKRARAAMEDPAHKSARQGHEKDLEVLRQRAREAMEGYERRTRRETKEKLARQRAQTAEEKKLQAERTAAELAVARQKAEADARAREAAEEQAYNDRIKHIEASESVIESLKNNKESTLNPVRTLRSDLARAVKQDHMTMSQISLKEQETARLMETRVASGSRRSTTIVLLLLFLILIGAGVGIFLFYPDLLPAPAKAPAVVPRVPSIITAEKQAKLNLDDSSGVLRGQIQAIRFQSVPKDTLINIYFTKAGPTGEERTVLKETLAKLDVTLPDNLIAFLSEEFMLGSYHGEENGNFLILKTRAFESTAYAMTQEESAVAGLLYNLFTGEVLTPELATTPFQDVVIRNHDVRVLRNSEEQTVMMYAFLDRETLVIAENVETFAKVLGRWETPPLVP